MIVPNNSGGSLVGNLLAAVCFGVLTIQTFSYYRAFPNDKMPLKLAIAFLWTLEAFQLACVTQALYWWFVTNCHNPLALERATWEFATYQLNAVCASFTVQTFFAYRLYSISSNLYVGVLVEAIVLIQFGFGAVTGIKSNMILEFEVIIKECTWIVEAWLIIQAIADVVIATSMCILLRHRRTGFQKTDSVINRLVIYTINTGMVTSVLSCISVGLFAKYGFDYGVAAIGLPMGSCYSITMLANLHARKTLRAKLTTPGTLELINYSIKKKKQQSVGNHGGEKFPATRIHVATEVLCDDGDINPTTDDTKVRFTAGQRPVWESR